MSLEVTLQTATNTSAKYTLRQVLTGATVDCEMAGGETKAHSFDFPVVGEIIADGDVTINVSPAFTDAECLVRFEVDGIEAQFDVDGQPSQPGFNAVPAGKTATLTATGKITLFTSAR